MDRSLLVERGAGTRRKPPGDWAMLIPESNDSAHRVKMLLLRIVCNPDGSKNLFPAVPSSSWPAGRLEQARDEVDVARQPVQLRNDERRARTLRMLDRRLE